MTIATHYRRLNHDERLRTRVLLSHAMRVARGESVPNVADLLLTLINQLGALDYGDAHRVEQISIDDQRPWPPPHDVK